MYKMKQTGHMSIKTLIVVRGANALGANALDANALDANALGANALDFSGKIENQKGHAY